MNKLRTKLIHEGNLLAEVDVELIESEEPWSPYLSVEDAYKLDEVRAALKQGDVEGASKAARVYMLTPAACAPN